MPRDQETRQESEDEEIPIFEAGRETPTEDGFKYDEEALNLVPEFKAHPEGLAALKRIVTKCHDDFDGAWQATSKFRDDMAKTWKLFVGTLDDRQPPMQHMANPHVPLLLENIVRMSFRQAYELFGNWTNVFGVTPNGPDDEETAKLLSLHGNWQLRNRIPDFQRQVGDRGLMIFNLFGDLSVHSYWDPYRRSNRHEVLTANEFVCANAHVSTMPDYSDVSWVAKVMFMDAHELRKMGDDWEDVNQVLDLIPSTYDDPNLEQPLRDAVDKQQGVDRTEYKQGQYKLIQYEGWLDLPGQDRDRYMQVIFDQQTRTVVSMRVHERTDPYDKRRFEFEMQQLEQYQQAVQAREQALMQYQQEAEQTKMQALMMAHEGPQEGDLPTQAVMMARAIDEAPPPELPEPPMPEWMGGDPTATPRPPDSRPIQMFAHAVNIEPIMGVLGIGPGKGLADQNRAANMGLSAFSDQATLGNVKNFIKKADVRFEGGGTLVISPGKIHNVIGAVDLQKDIMPLDFGPANPQYLNLVEMFMRFGNTITNTPEVLSGEAGKSGETAQGISARIEQATMMLSVPTQKYARTLTKVLKNNATLNSVFMPDVEWFSVNNQNPSLAQAMGSQQLSVGREMYDRVYDVEISADLKFTSTAQRIAEADALVQLPQAVPALAGNLALQYHTLKKSFEARNRYDLIPFLGAEPQPPPMFGLPSPMPPELMGGQPPAPGAEQGGGQQTDQAPTAAGQQQRGTPAQQ